jgi:hypothetical protein
VERKPSTTGHKIILFVDNFKGHNIDGLHLTHICLEFFTANFTAHVMQASFKTLKLFMVDCIYSLDD